MNYVLELSPTFLSFSSNFVHFNTLMFQIKYNYNVFLFCLGVISVYPSMPVFPQIRFSNIFLKMFIWYLYFLV